MHLKLPPAPPCKLAIHLEELAGEEPWCLDSTNPGPNFQHDGTFVARVGRHHEREEPFLVPDHVGLALKELSAREGSEL